MHKKYHIVVYGCQMNVADAERLAGVLESMGYKKTSNINEANLVAITMCSVRQSAVDRIFGLVEKFKKLKNKPKTLLTGCILKKDKKTFSGLFDYVIGASEAADLEHTLQVILHGPAKRENYRSLSEPRAGEANASGKSLPSAPDSKYIPISNGCNNFCTYCVVPYTRGRLICIDHNKIIKEAKRLIKQGFKEIWLLGQNVNDYSSPSDPSVDFSKLLEEINNLEGNFKIFFMSPNPKNFSDKLIKTMAKSEKFSRYLNLPIQAGDDEILKRMNRPYTSKQYIELVKKIRKAMPDINLSTDVIVGFPGETKKQFENTVKLFKKVKFNIAYINKYSPRRQTVAFKMEDNVPWPEKKRREKILIDIVNKKK